MNPMEINLKHLDEPNHLGECTDISSHHTQALSRYALQDWVGSTMWQENLGQKMGKQCDWEWGGNGSLLLTGTFADTTSHAWQIDWACLDFSVSHFCCAIFVCHKIRCSDHLSRNARDLAAIAGVVGFSPRKSDSGTPKNGGIQAFLKEYNGRHRKSFWSFLPLKPK